MLVSGYRFIDIDSDVCFGAPRFVNSRIPIHVLVGRIKAGRTDREVIESHPKITDEMLKGGRRSIGSPF